ncbi:hypothetical protein SERLA73DRAFT_191521 [Serpula lacrymans var. lacrymans S7.3]|uniref:Alpha/beta hydrolase fold-3 domain-containing protein n=2 Tax=Serpula lacrymans var. lacrymans TaxID=341189 RepID=F8QHR2_SERL3|nr:uncharacterized protein SERLADRAFT_447792 [Serpula lacrymans var. lacrymans S7.9]EGN92174.1 hypothetical protein SERLA73DRAFT_191521 [Serpula lacrymans var. lacrymans S7.3]EGO26643.1 hypothetical protein SERLADRAFT_447792 [Serpula lacrymans var. lacrymans S7.9]
MAYPVAATKDLSILHPGLHPIITLLPDTLETAKTADVVVNFMRAVPPRPHEDPEIIKKDIQVSMDDAPPEQPPTTVRLYIPKREITKGLLPVVIWSHHGGFFSAGPARLDPFCCSIAAAAGVIVAAPAYRKTPENPFPAPFDDVYQVLIWLTTSSETKQYSIDPNRIAVAGSSAGGTLAVGITLRYRDEGRDMSKIPLVILDDTSVTDTSKSYSTYHNPVNKLWNANVTRFMWDLYLPEGSSALDAKTRGYAVPVHAEDLKGLPSTMVLCAQWDDLTNDAILFAHRLLEAGVPTEIHTYRGTFHISDKLVHDTKIAAKKRRDIVDSLRAAFGTTEDKE